MPRIQVEPSKKLGTQAVTRVESGYSRGGLLSEQSQRSPRKLTPGRLISRRPLASNTVVSRGSQAGVEWIAFDALGLAVALEVRFANLGAAIVETTDFAVAEQEVAIGCAYSAATVAVDHAIVGAHVLACAAPSITIAVLAAFFTELGFFSSGVFIVVIVRQIWAA